MNKKNKKSLWAPWRIEFIRSGNSDKCFLCGKKSDFNSKDEEIIIARGKNTFIILNRYPYNSGHLMIAPYRHVKDVSTLTKRELYELMDMTVAAENLLSRLMSPQGFNIGFNIGAAAGAGLEEHIHFHVVPRWIGDTNFMPILSDTRVVPEALKDTAEMLRKAWK